MRWLAAAVWVMSAGAGPSFEVLENIEYRAVTIEPGQRKSFRVPTLEKVTASSGACVEEGMEFETGETFWLRATCGGVRTALVWRADGKRIHVLACAEDEKRAPAVVRLRLKLQGELKGSRQQTACVRNGRVELWGWASSAEDKMRLDALAAKYGDEQVKNFIELLEAAEE